MFVTRRDAETRLSSPANALRKKDACLSDNDREIPNTVDIPDAAVLHDVPPAPLPASAEEYYEESDELPESTHPDDQTMGPMLDKLDHLLNPRVAGRARYMGNLASQVAIAETDLILGQAATSNIFDLATAQVQAYREGNGTTGGRSPNSELKRRIEKSKEVIAEKAAARLDATLDALTPVKLSQVKRATNLAKIGKDMAVILEKVSPKESGEEKGVHFHIFRPEFKQENHYETVNLPASVIDHSTRQE